MSNTAYGVNRFTVGREMRANTEFSVEFAMYANTLCRQIPSSSWFLYRSPFLSFVPLWVLLESLLASNASSHGWSFRYRYMMRFTLATDDSRFGLSLSTAKSALSSCSSLSMSISQFVAWLSETHSCYWIKPLYLYVRQYIVSITLALHLLLLACSSSPTATLKTRRCIDSTRQEDRRISLQVRQHRIA